MERRGHRSSGLCERRGHRSSGICERRGHRSSGEENPGINTGVLLYTF
ncbi:MAG: hypothetical protein M0R67_05685 [Candidatus Cloacimonas sp.]|nr:hypothetical protein [Candidatus Cloacimonas sp.]